MRAESRQIFYGNECLKFSNETNRLRGSLIFVPGSQKNRQMIPQELDKNVQVRRTRHLAHTSSGGLIPRICRILTGFQCIQKFELERDWRRISTPCHPRDHQKEPEKDPAGSKRVCRLLLLLLVCCIVVTNGLPLITPILNVSY